MFDEKLYEQLLNDSNNPFWSNEQRISAEYLLQHLFTNPDNFSWTWIVAWAEKSLNFGLWAFSSLILSSCVIKKPLSPQHWVLSKLLARTWAQGHKSGPKIRLALFFSASWNYQGPNFAKKLFANTIEPRSLAILLGVYSHVSSSYLLVLGFKAICDAAICLKISQIFTNAPN